MRQYMITYRTWLYFLLFLLNIITRRNGVFNSWIFIWKIKLFFFLVIVIFLWLFRRRYKFLVQLDNEVTNLRLLLVVDAPITASTRWIISIFVFIVALGINSIRGLKPVVCMTTPTSTSSYSQNTAGRQVLTRRWQTIGLISWIRSSLMRCICSFEASFLPWRLFLLVVRIIIWVTL